jgi:hypothetical protein
MNHRICTVRTGNLMEEVKGNAFTGRLVNA